MISLEIPTNIYRLHEILYITKENLQTKKYYERNRNEMSFSWILDGFHVSPKLNLFRCRI